MPSDGMGSVNVRIDAIVRWHPRTARAAGMTHTWVTNWTGEGILALVDDAQAEGWACMAIGYLPNSPTASHSTAAQLQSGGVTVANKRVEVAAAFGSVTDRIERSTRDNTVKADQRPLLLLVGEFALGALNDAESDALDRIAFLGRGAGVHLAVNESLRPKTSWVFQDQVLSSYGGRN